MQKNERVCRCCGERLPLLCFYVDPRGYRALDCRSCTVMLRRQARQRRGETRKALREWEMSLGRRA